MTALTVQDGKLVLRDGALGVGQGCCCGGCECTCNSTFSLYANGARLNGGADNLPVYLSRGFTFWIPGISPYQYIAHLEDWDNEGARVLETDGWTGSAQYGAAPVNGINGSCDENGDLIVRINIYCKVEDGSTSAQIIESRFYKFDMSGGACGVLTGSPVDPPEDAELEGGFGDDGVIEGQTIVYAGDVSPDDISFRMDWSSVSIQASCDTQCTPGLYVSECPEECGGGCACSEVGFSARFSGEPDPLTLYACRLNPLP